MPGIPYNNPLIRLAPRIQMVVRIERFLLALRYLLAGILGAVLVQDPDRANNMLLLLGIAFVVQQVFVHGILYLKRYDFFVHPINFCIHLLSIVALDLQPELYSTPFASLFPLLIIGSCIYTPTVHNTLVVTFVSVVAYCFLFFFQWSLSREVPLYYPAMLDIGAIGLTGWIMHTMGRLLRDMEHDAQERAQSLASSEATLRTILNTTAAAIIVYGEDECITELNDSACLFLGVQRDELIGQRFRAFFFDDGTLPSKLASLRAKGTYTGEAIVISREGEEHTVNLIAQSFLRHGSRFFVCILQDISAQKRLQENTRLSTARLEQLNRELKQVNELRTEFFITVSQRVRSPLSSILGFLGLLLREELGDLTEEQRKGLQSCRRSIQRIFELIDDALRIDRFEVRQTPRAETAPETGNEVAEEAAGPPRV